jgi:DNA polymerase III, delta subunit
MINTHIFLTETFVDQNILRQTIALNYFKNQLWPDFSITNIDQIELNEAWTENLNSNLILLADFKDKEDFTDSILGFYKQYNLPTLLFLGDLSKYSLPLQEGMLRLLEEPPENLIVIIFAQNQTEILPTIVSRSRIHKLPRSWIFANLDQNLLEKVKSKLPPATDFAKDMLREPQAMPDLAKVEREELQFWLWQLLCVYEMIFKQNPVKAVSQKIEAVLTSMKLNKANVQKKLSLGTI